MYISAYNGNKELVQVLLQNCAEVNATGKVISGEWSNLIYYNVCQDILNDMQSVEMSLIIVNSIGQWCVDRVYDVSLCEFGHPCVG